MLFKLILSFISYYNFSYGDWGLGIGDWGLGIGPQSPIPNPQSPLNILLINLKSLY